LYIYFIIYILAKSVDQNKNTKIEVIDLIIELLNSSVKECVYVNDTGYIADLLSCLGEFKTVNLKKREIYISLLKKYLKLDYVFSSHRNAISCAALSSLAKLKLNNEIIETPNFLKYAKSTESSELRITAFKCICTLAIQDKTLISTLINLLKNEKNPYVRLEFIKIWHKVWERLLYFFFCQSQNNMEKKNTAKTELESHFVLHDVSFRVVDMIFLFKKQISSKNLKLENIFQFLKSLTTELWFLLTHPKNELERIALYNLWVDFF